MQSGLGMIPSYIANAVIIRAFELGGIDLVHDAFLPPGPFLVYVLDSNQGYSRRRAQRNSDKE